MKINAKYLKFDVETWLEDWLRIDDELEMKLLFYLHTYLPMGYITDTWESVFLWSLPV